MKKISLIILILTAITNIFAFTDSSNYWNQINNFNYSEFYTQYKDLPDGKSIKRGKLAFALYKTGEESRSWAQIAEENLSASIQNTDLTQI